jgi:hypothetical protein
MMLKGLAFCHKKWVLHRYRPSGWISVWYIKQDLSL